MAEVNPELVLEAARMARPKYDWHIREGRVEYDEYEEGMLACSVGFFPEEDADDWRELERALKREGWRFEFSRRDGLFRAENIAVQWRSRGARNAIGVENISDTFLLLQALSAQSGIPLYRSSSSDQPNPKTAGGGE